MVKMQASRKRRPSLGVEKRGSGVEVMINPILEYVLKKSAHYFVAPSHFTPDLIKYGKCHVCQ